MSVKHEGEIQLVLGGRVMDSVGKYTYLGSIISKEGRADGDVNPRSKKSMIFLHKTQLHMGRGNMNFKILIFHTKNTMYCIVLYCIVLI